MSEPIVRVLYERGAFTPDDTLLVSAILAIFGLGLPAFVLIKAFTPGYFAREDTRTPMIFAAISVAVNVSTGALTLFPSMGAPGIATASAVAGWVNAALLLGVLIRRGHWGRDAGLISACRGWSWPSAVMAARDHGAAGRISRRSSPRPRRSTRRRRRWRAHLAGAMLVYFAAAFGLGGADIGMIRRNIRRRGDAAAERHGTVSRSVKRNSSAVRGWARHDGAHMHSESSRRD